MAFSRECQKTETNNGCSLPTRKRCYCVKQDEAGVQLNAEQADWKDDTDDESEEQELEAHYMYMAQLQEVTPDSVDNSGPIFDDEPMHKALEQGDTNITIDSSDICYDRAQDDQDETDDLDQERDLLASLIQKLKYLKKFQAELDKYKDVNYASKVEIDCAKAKGDLIFAKPEFLKKAQKSESSSDMIIVVIPNTSVSRPQLKANHLKDRSMSTIVNGKKQEVEDHNVLQLCPTLNTPLSSNSFAARRDNSIHPWLLHRRLSHLNFDTINLLSKNNIVNGLPKLKFVKDHLCSSCELGKAKRKSFHSKTTPSSKRRLQLLHMDLCGPMRVESINGKKYVLVIVDDFSRYTWTHFLRSKDETPGVLIDFLTLVQRGLHAQVTTVRTDKGTEFLNKSLHAYFAKEGIRHETSTARTPEQNGVVERRNRTLVEAARTMLSAAKVPLFFWAEAIATACFTQNRSLVIPRHEKTPYHIINARKPSVKFFHIFGSLCYIIRDGENLDKMKEKGDA
ncbi:retrovirus-related pol polyprotein from transposon TNT 1-94 [Tanacetum coccineum]